MTLLEIYNSRKESLYQRLKESKSLYETGGVLSETLETMGYQYLTEPENRCVKEKVENLIKVSKSAFPLIESVNKSKLWDDHENGAPKKKNPIFGLVLLVIGVALVYGSFIQYIFIKGIEYTEVQQNLLLLGIGCLLILIAGFALFHRKKLKNKAVVEIMADPENLLKRFEEVIKTFDKILDSEKSEYANTKHIIDNSINTDEIQLFSYLLEAKYSGQPDFALEQLGEVEHYLKKMDVIIVDYSRGNERYFNFLEGDEERTARPALLRSGEVMIKGLAYVKNLKELDL